MLIGLSVFLAISAGLTQIYGYIEYGRKTFIGRIKPNAASWGIWAFGAFLESVSYIFLTKDWVKNILPVVCALSAITFFVIALKRKHFLKPTNFELFIVVVDIAIIFVWFVTSSHALANILFVLTAVVSFVPMINNTFRNPKHEHAFPWSIWTLAYLLMTVAVIMRWEKWEELVYPLVFVILHAVVAYLALDKRTQRVL
jgi:hypothetical protein